MGTISQKIEYLNETKTRQKNLINALGGNITNDTPFREYEKELVGVLPKVTGEGSNISLSPTIEYDLEVGYKGDTKQDTLEGYNLYAGSQDFSGTWNNENLWDNVTEKYNGLVVKKKASQWGGLSKDIELEVGTYTFSLYAKSDTARACSFYVGGGTGNIYPTSVTANITTTWTRYYFTFNVTSSGTIKARIENTTDGGTTNYTYICGYQLETGSSMKDYEPYCGGIPSPNPNYPQDIQVVTGTQEIEVVGKNLFDKTDVTANAYINTSGRLVTGATNYTASAYIKVPLGNITWSATSGNGYSLSIYDKDKNFIRSVGRTSNNAMTISIASGEEYIRFTLLSGDLNITQIEVGSTATTYSPYTSQTYTLHLGDEELAKIGSYQDKIYYDNGKWYKHNQIGKVIFDGDVNKLVWSMSTSTITGLNAFWFLKASFPSLNIVESNLDNKNLKMTNNFTYNYQEWKTVTSPCLCENSGLRPDMIIFSGFSDITTINQWNTWLSTHNTTMYYILKTETDDEITNTTLLQDLNYIKEHIKSYSDTTNISSSGDLSIVITASAIKQLS